MNTIIRQVRLIPLLLLGLLLSNSVSAQQTISLKDALNYAIQNSVKARQAKLDIEKGRYKTEEVRADALPNVTGNAGLTYNPIIGQLVFGNQSVKLGRNYNANAGATLNQQLFNQQVFTGLKAARASENYYKISADLTEEQVIELVANNYYQVLVNRQQLNVIDTNIKNAKLTEVMTNNQYLNGLAKKIDVDRITVKLTNLQNKRNDTQSTVEQLEYQLKYSMGMPVETPISLPPSELNNKPVLPGLAESIDVESRTEMKLLNVQKDLLTLQRKAYAAEYYPSLSLSANYTYTGQSDKFDLFKQKSSALWYDASAIGVTLKVPIFNGFATRSRVRQADVELKKAEEDRKDARNILNLNYENTKVQLKNSISGINFQRTNVVLAQQIYTSTQNNYKNGLASLTDLLDTEDALTEAQNGYTQALLKYKIAEIQLIKSNGNIKSLLQ